MSPYRVASRPAPARFDFMAWLRTQGTNVRRWFNPTCIECRREIRVDLGENDNREDWTFSMTDGTWYRHDGCVQRRSR